MASIKSALGGVGSSGGVVLGGVTMFPAQSPVMMTQYGATYLREGYFETTDYDPLLEPIAEQTMGFNSGYDSGNGSISNMCSADNDSTTYWISFVNNNGVFRSTDDGQTWTNITSTIGISVSANAKVKYISGVGETSVWLLQTTVALLRSTDGGNTWTNVATGTGAPIPAIAANGNIVLIAAISGVFRRSTDGGATFGSNTALNGSDRSIASIIYTKDNMFVILGATSVGTTAVTAVWVSDDNGASFGNALNAGLPTATLQGAVYASKYNRIYYLHITDLKVITAYSKTAITVSTFSLSSSSGSTFNCIAYKPDGALWVWQSGVGVVNYREQADNDVPISKIAVVASWVGSNGFIYNNQNSTKFFLITSGAVMFVCKKAVGLYISAPYSTTVTGNPSNVAPYMRVK